MSWRIEIYLELRQQGLIKPMERGELPLPEDVAIAMEQCAATIERHATTIASNAVPVAPDELRWLAAEIRDGTPAGRMAFRAALLEIVEIKRGNKSSGAVTRFLPVDMLAPFHAGSLNNDLSVEHANRSLGEIAATE